MPRVIVRQYGLLPPLNWGEDCFEHLFLQNKLWNRLVEIERENREQYRAILGTDEEVAAINSRIEATTARIADLDARRKELRKKNRAKVGKHTAFEDEAIKSAREELKSLAVQAKEIRAAARECVKGATDSLELVRREAIKLAYASSGLWWGNYNAVVNNYNRARVMAMKEGVELRFHRFDGSGRFTCQIQGGMSTEDLLAGRSNIVSLRLVSNGEFAILCGRKPAKYQKSIGSRRYERDYGILTITIYTGRNEQGEKFRRTLDFPIILHRSLPDEATLKILTVSRRKVGPDFRWSVTFTFTGEDQELLNSSSIICGINFGWKQVSGGLRVATIYEEQDKPRHIVLPQVIVDTLAYVNELKSRIDTASNENHAWLMERMTDAPEPLAEEIAAMRQAKRPHPARFAHFVLKWRSEFPLHKPALLAKAEKRRKVVKRLSLEHHHLRDKVLRRRLDFYRNEAKKIAERYSRIVLDKMDLRLLAKLENSEGMPSELSQKARKMRLVAAISELREWIVKQAVKTGAEVVMLPVESTTTCHVCGEKVPYQRDLVWNCSSCGNSWDQDENAAANLVGVGAVQCEIPVSF